MDKTEDKIISIIKEFKEDVKKKIKVDKLIFFGSRAKGTHKEDSDIDLLIVSDEFKSKKYFKRSPEFYLMWNYPYNVDILCLTPQELKKKEKSINIVSDAMQKGIEV